MHSSVLLYGDNSKFSQLLSIFNTKFMFSEPKFSRINLLLAHEKTFIQKTRVTVFLDDNGVVANPK